MTIASVNISSPPDFVITIGQTTHKHTISLSYQVQNTKEVKELFSHSSQIEVIKDLRLRLASKNLQA